MSLTVIIILVLIFFALMGFGLIILVVGIYNSLIQVKENVSKSWANIDVILKQRYDEVPQLIQVCEQYASYEKDMIDRIMTAREKMVSGKSVKDQADGFNELTTGLNGLLALGEAYPELKANENFLQIQTRLSHLEDSLADRREFYNDSVNIYNIRIQQIPDVFLAKILGYMAKELFKVDEKERSAPSLKMNL